MKQIQYILFILLILVAACMDNSGQKTNKATTAGEQNIPNGIYLIVNEFTDSVKVNEHLIIPFSHDFLDSNTMGQPLWLEIDTTEYVSLALAEKPNGVEQKDKRINLMLTLTDSAKTQLADFTERHVMDRVAIVIGGQAVTKHKVREKIDGGKLQITRCTDNACKYLLVELKNAYP